MSKSDEILIKARDLLKDEIEKRQQELRTLKNRLCQLDRILGTPLDNRPSKTISDALIDILRSSSEPLSTLEIAQQFRTLGIPQRAKNPYSSIQALLHHLKKSEHPKVWQDPVTGKWSATHAS
ncbi:MAG: hypothetical protein GX322_06725 [Firmicutes bacterium]|nr:hypothetical protein [Bacillota bacterium]